MQKNGLTDHYNKLMVDLNDYNNMEVNMPDTN